MDDNTQLAHKVTLSSERVVHLREMKIKHQTLASQAVGSKAGDNHFLMAQLMQQELLKILLIDVNGKRPTAAEREDLDNLFSFAEYSQLCQVVGKLMGTEDAGKLKTEIVSVGTR